MIMLTNVANVNDLFLGKFVTYFRKKFYHHDTWFPLTDTVATVSRPAINVKGSFTRKNFADFLSPEKSTTVTVLALAPWS
jgi:hypothetical protein